MSYYEGPPPQEYLVEASDDHDASDCDKENRLSYKASVEAISPEEAKAKAAKLIAKKASSLMHPRFSEGDFKSSRVTITEAVGPMNEPEYPFGSALERVQKSESLK